MQHKIILRVPTSEKNETHFYDELFEFCKAEIKNIDEIIFFTQFTHAVRGIEYMKYRMRYVGGLLQKFKPLGVKLGIDVLCTLGHHEEYTDPKLCGFDFSKAANGYVSKGRLCSSSEKTMEYIKQVYALAAEPGPDTIHIDDDLHYVADCRCENCEAKFRAEYTDTEENRIEYTRKRLCNIFRVIEQTVHSINPKIDLGFMTCHFGEDGTDYTDYANALKGEKAEVVWRPGGGVYNDESVAALMNKAHSIGRQTAALPEYVTEVYSEIENFPYLPLKKTPSFMELEIFNYLAAGCTATALNILSLDTGSINEYKAYLRAIDDITPFAKAITENTAGYSPIGIGKPYGKTVAIAEAASGDEIFSFGLPAAYKKDDCQCYILNLALAKRLSEEELLEVLKKGVMMDGETAEYLNGIGLGKYVGFKAQKSDNKWVVEHNLEHPLNCGKNVCRDARISFAWVDAPYVIEKTDADAEYLTDLIDYSQAFQGFSSGIYENSLGGRVYVSGYAAFSWHESLSRISTLKRIFRYLTRDTLSGYAESYHKVALWVREGSAIVSNLAAGVAENVRIAVKTEKNKAVLYRKNGASVDQKEILPCVSDGIYKIFEVEKMEYQETALLKFI